MLCHNNKVMSSVFFTLNYYICFICTGFSSVTLFYIIFESGEASQHVQCYKCMTAWNARGQSDPEFRGCIRGKNIDHYKIYCEYGCISTIINVMTMSQGER